MSRPRRCGREIMTLHGCLPSAVLPGSFQGWCPRSCSSMLIPPCNEPKHWLKVPLGALHQEPQRVDVQLICLQPLGYIRGVARQDGTLSQDDSCRAFYGLHVADLRLIFAGDPQTSIAPLLMCTCVSKYVCVRPHIYVLHADDCMCPNMFVDVIKQRQAECQPLTHDWHSMKLQSGSPDSPALLSLPQSGVCAFSL